MLYENIISKLNKVVGGKENIRRVTHCATRLRIEVRDNDKVVDKVNPQEIPECKGYIYQMEQHQFIFGTGKVNEIYSRLQGELNYKSNITDEESTKDTNNNLIQRSLQNFAKLLLPLIPALVLSGLFMGIRELLFSTEIVSNPLWIERINIISSTLFYLFPVFVIYRVVEQLEGNTINGLLLGTILSMLYHFELIGFTNETSIGPSYTILGNIALGFIMVKAEAYFNKIIPQNIQIILVPFLTIGISLVGAFYMIIPVFYHIEKWFILSFTMLLNLPYGIGYMLFGGLHQIITVTGIHHAFNIVEINLLNETSRNVIQPLITASMAGQLGAALGLLIVFRKSNIKKQICSSSKDILFGITEPLLFGINWKNSYVLTSGVIGGVAGSLLTYIFQLEAVGMSITFLPGILLYGYDMYLLSQYLLVILFSIGVGIITTLFQSKLIRKEEEKANGILEKGTGF